MQVMTMLIVMVTMKTVREMTIWSLAIWVHLKDVVVLRFDLSSRRRTIGGMAGGMNCVACRYGGVPERDCAALCSNGRSDGALSTQKAKKNAMWLLYISCRTTLTSIPRATSTCLYAAR